MMGLLRGVWMRCCTLDFGDDTMFCITEAIRTEDAAIKQRSVWIYQYFWAVQASCTSEHNSYHYP